VLTTKKLYLKFRYKVHCNAVVKEVAIENSAVRFDQTIAFLAICYGPYWDNWLWGIRWRQFLLPIPDACCRNNYR